MVVKLELQEIKEGENCVLNGSLSFYWFAGLRWSKGQDDPTGDAQASGKVVSDCEFPA